MQYRELYSKFYSASKSKESEKEYIDLCKVESLRCTLETNTTL